MKIENIHKKLARRNIDFTSWGNSVRFDLPEETIYLHPCGKLSNDYAAADCSFKTTPSVFNAILEGNLDPVSSIITGKLFMAGDVNTAIRLKNIFQ